MTKKNVSIRSNHFVFSLLQFKQYVSIEKDKLVKKIVLVLYFK